MSKWDPFWSPILVSLPQRMAGKCVWCLIPLILDFFRAIVLQLYLATIFHRTGWNSQKIVQPRYELLWFLILHPESTSAVTLSGIIATQLRPNGTWPTRIHQGNAHFWLKILFKSGVHTCLLLTALQNVSLRVRTYNIRQSVVSWCIFNLHYLGG